MNIIWDSTRGHGGSHYGSAGFAHALGPSEVTADVMDVSQDNPTNAATPYKFTFPTGALYLLLNYKLLPTAAMPSGQYIKYVINAASDADALGKLATADAHSKIFINEPVVRWAARDDLITRIDFVAAVAIGAELTTFYVQAGIKA